LGESARSPPELIEVLWLEVEKILKFRADKEREFYVGRLIKLCHVRASKSMQIFKKGIFPARCFLYIFYTNLLGMLLFYNFSLS